MDKILLAALGLAATIIKEVYDSDNRKINKSIILLTL